MRLSLNIAAVAALLAIVFAPGLAAQPSLLLTGRVVDTLGAVVPGATIVVRRPGGAEVATQVTDQSGQFQIIGLPPGDYAVAASLHGFSVAQAEVALGEPVALQLTLAPGALAEDITVIATRLVGSEEMLRRVPGSFDLLTRDVLKSAHVFTTSEALRKVPGVTVRDEEGLGLRPNIGMRGLNPTRSSKVLLLEDGLAVAFAPYGDNATYYHPPIERFDRVEVLKGSSQIAYGPVTLGGVINYITPEAPKRPALAVDFTAGNRDYLQAGGSFGGTYAGTGIFGQALTKRSDGARDNVHSDLTDLMVKASRPWGATRQVTAKATYYGEDSQVTYSGLREDEFAAAPRQNPFANDGFEGGRVGLSAGYRALLGAHTALTATAYGSHFARDWWRQSSNSAQRPNDAADPACGGMENLNTTCGNEGRLREYRHAGVEARTRTAFRAGVPQETDLGFRVHAEHQDRRQENGSAPISRSGVLVEDNERTTDAVSAFVQHRVLAGAWTLTPGVRVERVWYSRTNRLLGVSGTTDLTELVPGFGVSYGPSTETTVFGGVHRGFAPPRAEDIINNTTGGTVDLDPERSWNYEVGGRTRIGSGLALDATLFRLDYENQIVPASLAGGVGSALTNGGETLHQGVEFGANGDWRRLAGTPHGVYMRAAVMWLPVARFTGTRTSSVPGFGSVNVSGNRLPYAPETTSTAAVGYRHEAGLDLQLEAQRVGDQFGDDLNTVTGSADGQRGEIPAYSYLNLAASWRIPRTAGSLFLAVKNLTDRTFIIDRTRGILPGHSRLVQVGASWRF
jgi:Fe(3+) dicitrate transport protein